MFLELSEVFVCPDCRPAQGLVVLVDDIEDRRVREGHLGCPECEMKVPIREGVLRFDDVRGDGAERPGAEEGPAGPGAALLAGVDPEEGATRLAALLGADRVEGCLLLGPGLEAPAAQLARLAGDAEVLVLADESDAAAPPAPGVSRALGIDPADLPVVTGRIAGVALVRPSADAVREAVRVLEEGGRAVLLEPSPEARGVLDDGPVGVAAAGKDAVVAIREPGAAPARS